MRLLFLVLLMSSASVAAQPADYFPLGASDTWTYGYIVRPPNAPPDTVRSAPVQIQASVTVRDTAYTVVSLPAMPSDTLRLDAEGRVWGRIENRDVLILDVTLDAGATYEVQVPDYDLPFTVTVSRDVTVETPAGRFENAIGFSFDIPEYVDDERSIELAPGVGIVRVGEGFTPLDLLQATVGGTVILDRDDGPDLGSLRAFPSPFARTLTVELAAGEWHRVEVIDARGRRVATLLDGRCGGACRVTWDAEDAAPGVYTVVATGPSGAARQRVVRVR